MNFSYAGDGNYAAQNLNATLVVNQVPLVATALPATRAYGAPNPVFTGTLAGVVNSDAITASYVSQAMATTAAGTYTTAPYAITPILADPNNRLTNYVVTLNDGALTISGPPNTITFSQIPAQVYGNPPLTLSATAASGQPVTFSLVSGPAILNNNQLQLTGAGTVTLTASQAASQSYAAGSATQSFVVSPAPLTVVVQNATRGPNQANPVFNGTVTGFVKGDTAASTQLTFTTTAILKLAGWNLSHHSIFGKCHGCGQLLSERYAGDSYHLRLLPFRKPGNVSGDPRREQHCDSLCGLVQRL